MKRSAVALALWAGLAATPLAAQKTRPPAGPPAPVPLAPAPSATPTQPARDTAATAPGKRRAPATLIGAPSVRPERAAAAARPAAAVSAFSAGLAAPAFEPEADAFVDYAGRLAVLLDSAIIELVEVFRNTSGQPLAGASSPAALSQREKDRWTRCRNVYWDLTTYHPAFIEVLGARDPDPPVVRQAEALDSVLAVVVTDSAALAECDNVSSMIEAPARWTPWDQQYQGAARRFYTGWYADIRNVHERVRAFVIALNATVPADQRFAVPPALQRNPPYAGATPR